MLDRYSGHSILATNCLLLFLIVGIIPSCWSIHQVIILYMVAGVCLGLNNGLANTLITWLHAGRNVGPWVNLINACFGLGASSAPLLFVSIEHSIGNGLVAFSVIASLAAVPGLAASLLQAPSRPAKVHAAPSEGEREAPSQGLGSSHVRSTIAGIDVGSRAGFVRMTVVYPMMMVMTLTIGSEIAYAGWVYSYAMSRVGMRSTEAAYLNSLFWTAFTAGRVCTIPLAALLSPASLILPTMTLEVASMLFIHFNPTSASALWVGTIGGGLGVCALYSNLLSMLASYDLLTPGTVSAMGIAAALGHVTVPNVVGYVIHTGGYGYAALIWIVSAAYLVALSMIAAVTLHLKSNFIPIPSSVHGRKLEAARRRAELEKAASV